MARSVFLAIGIICIILLAGLVGVFAYYMNDQNNRISSLNSHISSLNTQISDQYKTISSLSSQISQLNSNITSLQDQVKSYNPNIVLLTKSVSSTILYATYNLSWGDDFALPDDLISGGGKLPVANYSSMSVSLQFENVSAKDEEWNAMWSAFAFWYLDNTNETLVAFDYLPYTLDTVSPGKGTSNVGVYSIKAPYVTLTPTLVNVYDCGYSNQFSPHANESATAICKIYVYLSQNQGTPSDQALNYQQLGMIHDTATATDMTFGPYLTEGYSQIYIQMTSNASCQVLIDDGLYPPVIYDSFVLSGIFQKNYEVQSQEIRLEFSAAKSLPWEVFIRIYLRP